MGQGVGVGSIMWIALTNGWLSIVSHREYPEMLLIRARKPEHIQDNFPEVEVYVDAGADYPYRANVLRTETADIIADILTDIQYDNFKNNVEDYDLADYLGNVWHVMYGYGIPHRPNTSSEEWLNETGGI